MYIFIFATILVAIIIAFLYYRYGNTLSTDASLVNKPVFLGKPLIPKIVIQTWKSQNVPQRYMSLIESVKKYNPDYQYYFFTDESIEDFLKLHYPEYLSTYLNLPIKIQKIDFFRYIAVYHYGGFYLDLDMKVNKNFDTLLQHSCIFPVDEYIDIVRHCEYNRYKPFCKKGQNFLLGQYAFAAAPKDPFIKLCIDKIHNNINNYIKTVDFTSDDYIYKTTGPDFVTEIFTNYKDKNNITIIDNGKRQCFGDYATHMYFGTWK